MEVCEVWRLRDGAWLISAAAPLRCALPAESERSSGASPHRTTGGSEGKRLGALEYFLMARLLFVDQSLGVKNFFCRLFWFVVILAVLFFGGWGFENWRGGSEWRKSKERAARMGVSLKLEDYAAEEIPEGESLMEDPVFLAEWNGEIEPVLDRITHMALEGVGTKGVRAGAVWRGKPFDYRQYFEEEISEAEAVRRLDKIYQPIATRLEKLGQVVLAKPKQGLGVRTEDIFEPNGVLRLKKIANAFQEFARISLRKGEPEKAVWAYEVIVRLGENFSEPALIDLLVSNSVKGLGDRIIWDGIWLHKWDRKQLNRLAALIQTDPDYDALEKTLKYEAASVSPLMDQAEEMHQKWRELWDGDDPSELRDRVADWMAYRGPSGWQDWRKATMLNAYLDSFNQRPEWEAPGKKGMVYSDKDKRPLHPLSAVRSTEEQMGGLLSSVQERTTLSRLARIAIELEKYRLQKKRYPESLDELNVTFSIQDLTDPKGRELKYEKTGSYFHLWSEFGREKDRPSEFEWKFAKSGG